MKLEPDAVCAITRDYLDDPVHDRRVEWHIEAVEPPETYRLDDAELARRFRAAVTWLRDQANIVPLALGDPNTVDEPYGVPQQTFGWAQPVAHEIAPLAPLGVVPEASAAAFAVLTGCCVSPVSPSDTTCPLQAALKPTT